MRKIKNKYEILVIIRKVKMTKRMLKSKLTMVSMLWWMNSSFNGSGNEESYYSAETMVKEVAIEWYWNGNTTWDNVFFNHK